MNVITRGIRNTLRSPLKSGAIVLMLAISTGLILAMLVARGSVETKVAEIKGTTATEITINPAGIMGGMGGGDPLTNEQIKKIQTTAHVKSVSSTLTDQLGSSETNLTPSFELGAFGKRQMRFETRGSGNTPAITMAEPDETTGQAHEAPSPRTRITGTTNPAGAISNTSLTSGEMIDGNSSEPIALVGKTLAEKNNLAIGSTFTAYGKTLTVKGIYSTDNAFVDSGVIIPLKTLQIISNQPDAVSNATAIVDSSENVAATTAALKEALGDKADITSQLDQAENILKPLESIGSLATGGVIAATTAGATIVLLSMIMIVRERRREIGVLKAIGGTNVKVIVQFISEALTLTIIGGIIGLTIGIAASGPLTQSLLKNSQNDTRQIEGQPHIIRGGNITTPITTQLQDTTKEIATSLTPAIFAASVGITLLIAIIGSAVPAWFITRIRPAEVLRTE